MSVIPLWVKALILAAILAAGIGAVKAWEHRIDAGGYKRAETKYQGLMKKADEDAKAELAAKTAKYVTDTMKLTKELADLNSDRFKKDVEHEKTVDSLRADARSSKLRLSIAINTIRSGAASSGAAAAPGPGGETRAEVVPGVADAILGIAGDIAKGVRDYNAVVALYNKAVEACNAP